MGRRIEIPRRQGAGEGEAFGASGRDAWAFNPVPVPSADALGSVLGSEELMEKVLRPRMSSRGGRKGGGLNGPHLHGVMC